MDFVIQRGADLALRQGGFGNADSGRVVQQVIARRRNTRAVWLIAPLHDRAVNVLPASGPQRLRRKQGHVDGGVNHQVAPDHARTRPEVVHQHQLGGFKAMAGQHIHFGREPRGRAVWRQVVEGGHLAVRAGFDLVHDGVAAQVDAQLADLFNDVIPRVLGTDRAVPVAHVVANTRGAAVIGFADA